MEKLSLNEVLALLLPGLFAMFSIQLMFWAAPSYPQTDFKELLGFFEKNEFLNTTFFLLVAIVLGAVVQRITALQIDKKLYNSKAGLYKRTGLIFSDINMLQDWLPFYNADCKKLFGFQYDGADITATNEKEAGEKKLSIQGRYFDYIFYAMMNLEKNHEARAEQNFYFFFRNLFTVSIIALLAGCVCFIIFCVQWGWQEAYLTLVVTLFFPAFAFIICRPLGVWYRRRMIRILFYQYYIEKSDKELQHRN